MNNLIKPYDLGDFQIADYSQKININDLVRQAQKELKLRLVEGRIEALGINITLSTTQTRFNGKRLWFMCPICNRRTGILYQHSSSERIGCRACLNLKYKKQRFSGMLEVKVQPNADML